MRAAPVRFTERLASCSPEFATLAAEIPECEFAAGYFARPACAFGAYSEAPPPPDDHPLRRALAGACDPAHVDVSDDWPLAAVPWVTRYSGEGRALLRPAAAPPARHAGRA